MIKIFFIKVLEENLQGDILISVCQFVPCTIVFVCIILSIL